MNDFFLVPSKAPAISVNASQRQSLDLILAEIDTLSWNAVPRGYRIYYQSLLKLEEASNLTTDYIEGNYDHVDFIVNVNFTEQGNQSYLIILKDLDVFTNYSIIASAYSSVGVGSLRQIFWRTDQGGRPFLCTEEPAHARKKFVMSVSSRVRHCLHERLLLSIWICTCDPRFVHPKCKFSYCLRMSKVSFRIKQYKSEV